jgi:hypothetical protein
MMAAGFVWATAQETIARVRSRARMRSQVF